MTGRGLRLLSVDDMPAHVTNICFHGIGVPERELEPGEERYWISQDAYEAGAGDVRGIVGKRVRSRKTAVLCSHGPVLPEILREIALATGTMPGGYLNDAASLETGGFSVVHLSATNPASGIVSIETYAPVVD